MLATSTQGRARASHQEEDMYSMAYEPRIATALAQQHIDREVARATARATARSARLPRMAEETTPVRTRRPLRIGLGDLARRVAASGAHLRAHA
jgi:hypothetical protein